MRVSESSGDFVGRLWTVSDGNQPTLSSLWSTNSSMWAPCTIFLFSKLTPWWIETKRPHILFMCQKCGERRVGRRERGHITLSAGWYHSILADQFSQTEGDEKRASTRRREGGKQGELKWWSYWFVKEIQRCVFCLNVHINLSCQRWAGMNWHLATPTWIGNFLLGLAVHSPTCQPQVERW